MLTTVHRMYECSILKRAGTIEIVWEIEKMRFENRKKYSHHQGSEWNDMCYTCLRKIATKLKNKQLISYVITYIVRLKLDNNIIKYI